MIEAISGEGMIRIIEDIADRMKKNKEYLTKLDSPIGDADHGINMNRGFKEVLEKLKELDKPNPPEALRKTGMALMAVVGGAAGPLYGQLFIKAGSSVSGAKSISKSDYIGLLSGGIDGVVAIGGAKPGQKTMVDALDPALSALKEEVEKETSFAEAALEAAESARQGVIKTVPIVAEKGRASYLGERSKGFQDPGATSTFLILQEIAKYLRQKFTDYTIPVVEGKSEEPKDDCNNFDAGICEVLQDVCPVSGEVLNPDCFVYKTLAKKRT